MTPLRIDCIAERLTYSFIGKRFHRIVQVERLHQVHGALQDLELISQLVRLRRWSPGKHVDGSAFRFMTMESVFAHTRKVTFSILAGVPQYSSNFSTTKFSCGDLDTYLYGPVPMGSVSGFSLEAGMMAVVILARKSESGRIQHHLHRFLIHDIDALNIGIRLYQRFSVRGIGASVYGIFHVFSRYHTAVMEFYPVPSK